MKLTQQDLEIINSNFSQAEIEKIKSMIEDTKTVDIHKLSTVLISHAQARDEIVNPLIEEYQKRMDDEIIQALPWSIGDIIANTCCSEDFYIYQGVYKENIILTECDRDGKAKNKPGGLTPGTVQWMFCNNFKLYKGKENNEETDWEIDW